MSLRLLPQPWVRRGGSAVRRLLRTLPGAEGVCFGVTDWPQVTSLQALILAVNLEELPNLAEAATAFMARSLK